MRDRAILVTVAQAYGSVLERGRYPRGAVYVDENDRPLRIIEVKKPKVRRLRGDAGPDVAVEIVSDRIAPDAPLPGVGTRVGPWDARLDDYIVIVGAKRTAIGSRASWRTSIFLKPWCACTAPARANLSPD